MVLLMGVYKMEVWRLCGLIRSGNIYIREFNISGRHSAISSTFECVLNKVFIFQKQTFLQMGDSCCSSCDECIDVFNYSGCGPDQEVMKNMEPYIYYSLAMIGIIAALIFLYKFYVRGK